MRNTDRLNGIMAMLPVLFCMFFARLQAQESPVYSLNGNSWKITSEDSVWDRAKRIRIQGETISQADYPATNWLAARVPGTVFGDQVAAGLYPEPSYGLNAYSVKPEKIAGNFWYRTEFTFAPAAPGRRVWLNFDGVNRDARVFLNGKRLGRILGFYQRGRFEVTDLLRADGRNVLAVLVDWPPVTINGRQNFNSPTFICSKGWDWMPPVAGMNMGIHKDVYLTTTGEVSLADPWIQSDLPKTSQAELSLQVEVVNHAATAVDGELRGEINPGHLIFAQPIRLAAKETRTVRLGVRDFPVLRLENPRLWWPNGYGDPNLYSCRLVWQNGPAVSDAKTVSFGIKKYTGEKKDGVFHLAINGVPLFLKGGSWGMSEFLLRCDAESYDTRVRLHREMNFNVIRNWMGMVADDAFYQACDKYGLMVWDEFWLDSLGGSVHDTDVFLANAIEKIKRVRNHPSIALWCGMNEGTPDPELNEPLRDYVKTYDGNDRQYLPNSCGGTDANSGLSGSGPWYDLDLKEYFTGVPTGRGDIHPFGMRSELGTPTFTSFDSFRKFMPKENWWPRNDLWNKHFFAGADDYIKHMDDRYGPATGIEDFCRKAQLLNLEVMKAMFEGWLDHSGKEASGLIIWMSQSAYPSFVWQTYDYYFDLTGAYFGAKTACEPIHIYWNRADDRIRVVNTTGKTLAGLTATAWIYNPDGMRKTELAAVVDAKPDAVVDCFKLGFPPELSPTHFIKLRLTAKSGQVVSENFYWRGTRDLDYAGFNRLKPVQLAVATRISPTNDQGMAMMTATITNPADSGTVALAIRPKLVKEGSDQQILPVFMNDGYFSLVPGEGKVITIEYKAANAGTGQPGLQVECWNNFTPRYAGEKK